MMEGVLTGMKLWIGGGNTSIPQCVRQEMSMEVWERSEGVVSGMHGKTATFTDSHVGGHRHHEEF